MNTDVLIVGAGPTGLMAAALLVRSGVNVRIIDKNEQEAHESRALAVQAKSMELFHNLGLIDEVLKRGMITKGMQLFINGKRKGQISFPDLGRTDTPYSFLLMLSQAETEKILVEDLKSKKIFVERGVEAIDLEQCSSSVRVTIKNSYQTNTIEASYVIGADGAHSVVRKLLGLSFEGGPYPQHFVLADVKVEWPLEHNRLCVFMHGKSFGAYFPLHDKEMGRILAISADKNIKDPSLIGSEPISLEDVQSAFSKVTHLPTKLSHPAWLARFYIHHRGVDHYQVGRVFVAGDSAHIHSPIGAQGMNTGLQDVANLCWKLAMVIKGQAPDRLLETYHSERWPIGQKLLNFTDRLFVLIVSQNLVMIVVRNIIFRTIAAIASKSKAMRLRAFGFISQLGIRYHSNEFITEQEGKLSPGCRAPNAKIKNEIDIFDLITGYRFHLLVFSKIELKENEKKSFHDLPNWIQLHMISIDLVSKEEIFSVYEVTNEAPQALYLIRPDGHIAFRAVGLDIAKLKDYLHKFKKTE